jgi:putative transposase
MTRSAKGTIERPGRNVAAKSGLNRAVGTAVLTWGATLCAKDTRSYNV